MAEGSFTDTLTSMLFSLYKILELEIFTFEFSICRSIFKQTRLEWLDIKVGFEELTEV